MTGPRSRVWGRTSPNPTDLPVTCWCEQHIVHVPAHQVKEGRTRSCGRPGCHEPQAT